MTEPSAFLAWRPPGKELRFFQGNEKGLYRFFFVDFWQREPRVFNLNEVQTWPSEDTFLRLSQKPLYQSKDDYLQLLRRSVDILKKGELRKVVHSRAEEFSGPVNPRLVFEALAEQHPEATVYLFSSPQTGTWVGATPETLLLKDKQRLYTMSLAGTLSQPEAEFGAKEKEEQRLVTDFIFEVLHDDPQIDQIEIRSGTEMKTGQLRHLLNEITAHCRPDYPVEVLAARLHPTPAVAGLPREKAMPYLAQHEAYQRSFYSGYFGLVQGGSASFYVNLRCAQFHPDGQSLYAGGGITALSIPEKEWQETEAKLKPLKTAIGLAQ